MPLHETDMERAARFAMGDSSGERDPFGESDPLPPGPHNSPFGYFRLAILIFGIFVAVLLAFMTL